MIILLDEYDTPMQEAYLYAYWNDFTSFVRNFFNATFKTNPYLERALMTGITRVSKESVFSDLNNLNVVTVTSDEYATAFGFTEKEVFDALDEAGLSEEKILVKSWYDGFVFGQCKDMYNPWSITNFLDKRELQAYWADTSSNRLVGRLIQTASGEIKEKMELLLEGTTVIENFDEQIVFEQLDHNESAIWSLLLASGYLKAVEIEYRGIYRKPWFHLAITNMETEGMFAGMFRGWFSAAASNYNGFVKAMLSDDKKAMNYYMNKVALSTFSFFDTGKHVSQNSEPERFYYGFVLGLIAELSDEFDVEITAEDITVVAVDGYRLALRREKIENPEERILNFVAPSPALREVEKILGDTDDSVSFTLGTKHIMFQIGNATLVCRLLEGEFLDWRRVVPTDNPIRLAINVKNMTESLERVSLIVSEKLKSPVRCTFGENVVALRTSNSIGNAYDECPTAGSGGDMEIGFNCKYLLEALRAVPTENISMELKTNLSPAVITPCEGDKFTYMVLPVRLKAE